MPPEINIAFCFSYVYIPLLPVALLEVLHTPTPFIAGVNTAIKPDSPDLVRIHHGTRDVGPMLSKCWASNKDDVITLTQH